MNGDQDGWDGFATPDVEADGTSTAPIRPPAAGPVDGDDLLAAAVPAGALTDEYIRDAARRDADEAAPVRALTQDVDRLADLVAQLAEASAVLGERLDGEVGDVLARAEQALAEARAARRAAAEADDRTRLAEARAEAARQEAAAAAEELRKGMAAAKASVAAAQNSEANAWREAGAAQQARASSANEAAHAEGLRKRAEALWNSERQARVQAESERDELETLLATEQSALALAHTELEDTRAEVEDFRSRLEAAAKSERDLRAELAAAQGEIQRLTVELDAATERADEQAARADRAERLADAADERADDALARADRAERRADAADARADRDAATVAALQETLRAALDLPAVEDLGDDYGTGVPVGDFGAILAQPDGLIGIEDVPDVLDGETAARFARAVLAVRVHQATRRPLQADEDDEDELAEEFDADEETAKDA